MTKKRFNLAREIFKIKNNIYKIIPNVEFVDIKVQKSEDHTYESQILIKIGNHKKILAIKTNESIKIALQKSHQAVIRQIKRIKEKKARRRNKLIEQLDLITPATLRATS